jgi:hypothetical protein
MMGNAPEGDCPLLSQLDTTLRIISV